MFYIVYGQFPGKSGFCKRNSDLLSECLRQFLTLMTKYPDVALICPAESKDQLDRSTFPAPFLPTRPKICPSGSSIDISNIKFPYVFRTFCIVIIQFPPFCYLHFSVIYIFLLIRYFPVDLLFIQDQFYNLRYFFLLHSHGKCPVDHFIEVIFYRFLPCFKCKLFIRGRYISTFSMNSRNKSLFFQLIVSLLDRQRTDPKLLASVLTDGSASPSLIQTE